MDTIRNDSKLFAKKIQRKYKENSENGLELSIDSTVRNIFDMDSKQFS